VKNIEGNRKNLFSAFNRNQQEFVNINQNRIWKQKTFGSEFFIRKGVGLTTTKKKDEIIIIFRWKQTWNQKFDETGGKEQLGKF